MLISEGSSLSETEKDVQPHIVKLFSGQPSSEPSTQQGGMSGRLSSRRGTEEVQMRQDSSTLVCLYFCEILTTNRVVRVVFRNRVLERSE